MKNTKEINIKNRTCYFFDDMINIKDFDPNLLQLDKKSYKNIGSYYIRYITMKNSDYLKISSVNLLYIIIDEVGGSIEVKNGNKYLTFASTLKKKKALGKCVELWDEIKYHIKTINGGESGEYGKDLMKIKFSPGDNLPLSKILKLHNLI